MFEIPHRPDVRVADVLALTHACTTANDALVNYSMYVPQETLKLSHRPDGKVADVLASTLARTCETHVLLVVCRVVVFR